MRPRLVGVLVIALLAAAGVFWLRRPPRPRPPAPAKKVAAPAPAPVVDTALILDAVVEKSPGQRVIRLTAKEGGQATLVLEDAQSRSSDGFGFGRARLEAPADRSKGAAFVEAVARWLQQAPPPAGRSGELEAFPLTYMRLGAGDGWEANTLVLQKGAHRPEIFFNLSADGRRARLVEKDEDHREDLVTLLALALRDGSPARRSPQNDPLVASMEPLFGLFQPLARGNQLRAMVPIEGGFLAGHTTKKGGRQISEVLLWKHPREAPRQVATSPGLFYDILPAPGGGRCVLAIGYPRGDFALGRNDPAELVVLDLSDGSVAKVVDVNAFGFTGAVAPDGRQVAIAQGKVTQVYDLATRQLVATTGPALDVDPVRWSAEGLVLQHIDFGSGKTPVTLYRWQPGQGEPQELPGPLPSPDGRYRLAATEEGLTISGPGGTRQVKATRPEDVAAFDPLRSEDDPRWLGPQHLLVTLDEPMALDLSTGKLHYLFPAAGMRVEASSPDGRILIARDERGDSYWAERK
jgi:hypothetical protein